MAVSIVIAWAILLFIYAWVFFIRRAVKINMYRLSLLNRIAKCYQKELQLGDKEYNDWRYKVFLRASRIKMILQFWKSPHEFYSQKLHDDLNKIESMAE